ncbi:unnamed protein product [Agarophyton chilense]
MKTCTEPAFVGKGASTFLNIDRRIAAFRRSDVSSWRRSRPRAAYPPSRAQFIGKLTSDEDQNSGGNDTESPNANVGEKGSVEDPGHFFAKLEEARKGREEAQSNAPNLEAKPGDVVDKDLEVSTTLVPEDQEPIPQGLQSASRALWRIGWVTWWLQLILTVIAAVILLFAFLFPGINVRSAASAVGFAISGAGIVFAFLSLFWTYGYTRLALWLRDKQIQEKAKLRINRKLRFGLLFSITGIVTLLLGLQAIVGTLLARLLGTGGFASPYASAQNAGRGAVLSATGLVQPVDILVVQACANGLTGLMIALVATIWFRTREKKWTASKELLEKSS